MSILLSCEAGTLAPYVPSADMPWDERRVQHLYRRLAFGASHSTIQAALQQSPQNLVDALIDEALAAPLPDPPVWANWTVGDYDPDMIDVQVFEQFLSWNYLWMQGMLQQNGAGLRDKLALFWSNHFVTRFESYFCPSYMYEYHKILQQYALGNFKEFTKAIGITPAMLIFLNGVENNKFEPNENYARELYELFTLGADNGYTQQDIVETARALTGWNGMGAYCGPIEFVPFLHDDGEKTIFGQTGNWGYDDVHDILFAERQDQIATHICRKIYKYFVGPQVDVDIVAQLAQTFKDNNFELEPVYRQLFKSEHFFHDNNIGVKVKSPYEMALGLIAQSGLSDDDSVLESARYLAEMLGQELFSPIDVAGWPGDTAWINSGTLTGRWLTVDYYLYYIVENFLDSLRDFAVDLVGGFSNDPQLITEAVVNHFLPNSLQTPEAMEQAVTVFKWEVPQNYYDQGLWNLGWETAPYQVAVLIQHIARKPEFQLC